MKAYVVIGETGECEDTHTWVVCAYADEDQAVEHVKALNALTRPLNAELSRLRDLPFAEWSEEHRESKRLTEEFEKAAGDLDPGAHVDSFVKYEAYEVPLVRHIDEFKSAAQETPKRIVGYYDGFDAGGGT